MPQAQSVFLKIKEPQDVNFKSVTAISHYKNTSFSKKENKLFPPNS